MGHFIERVKAENTTHERRKIAAQVAGGVTALLFVVWIATLGVRLATTNAGSTQNENSTAATLVAVQAAASSTFGY